MQTSGLPRNKNSSRDCFRRKNKCR